MNYARNYKNLLNFVKVMPKILVVPFFSGHGVYFASSAAIQLIQHRSSNKMNKYETTIKPDSKKNCKNTTSNTTPIFTAINEGQV